MDEKTTKEEDLIAKVNNSLSKIVPYHDSTSKRRYPYGLSLKQLSKQ